ncbi:sigma-70 family RNA polymerase sigma factor [Streptomyces sp. PKU-EA00015]|uniref:RNA polymerase sigma factor n=1 Tax=Streptomyces sp. PKU-EA00015 TaxID=2748326 RepID=UPI00159F7C16|nr:sigma-70 family RNA polymerase sigma factor [Streptomyces sp. PKU-EA00015]NWF26554.1 sigma-70 family RNA polymerase sigma factor [Streptomyces sp. PKU-EA00015]
MATDTQPEHSGGQGAEQAHERWQRAWSHREQLLRVARRRSVSMEDAEDAVHEAMLRAAEQPHLDDERLGAWLTTVTMRLCVDRHRQVSREAEVRTSPTLHPPRPAPVDEAVCDRAEARWLAVRSGELPARQAEALWLKSEDLDVGQVAMKMGLSYRTVESLLARARRTLRNSLAATLGLALWLCGRGRPRGGHAQAVAVASTAATLAVAGLVLPYAPGGDTPGPRPATPAVATSQEPGPGGPGPTAPSPLGSREEQPVPSGGAKRRSEPVLPELPLPEVSLPPLPLRTSSVPRLPVLPEGVEVPEVPVPDVPSATSQLPELTPPPVPTPSVPVPVPTLP